MCVLLFPNGTVDISVERNGKNIHWEQISSGDVVVVQKRGAIKVSIRDETAHRWASDLLKEKRRDGCRWREGLASSVWLECPTGEPEDVTGLGIAIEGWPQTKPAWETKERHTLDWCINHGETRVLREGRP